MTIPQDTAPAPIPDPGTLFRGFLYVGVCGFGGVLPWARRMIVEQKQWLNASEFNDLLAVCQFLPGPNVINVSVALGARFAGWRGAIAALAGLMAAPMAIILCLAVLYNRYGQVGIIRHMFTGLAAAASALVLATALRIAAPLRASIAGMIVAVVTFAAVALLGWPMLPVLVVMMPLSIGLAWFGRRAAQ
ncbi:MAG: chromate transporter [Rhodospirillales bacterium]|nr:chromate transporter [Rhodospirillales bacterium]